MTWGSPLGVIVDEYVVFHCQFEVWDLLTHPPRESTQSYRSVIHLTLSPLSVWVWEVSQREKRLPTEWSRWFHEQHHGVYPENRGGDKILNYHQYKPVNSTEPHSLQNNNKVYYHLSKTVLAKKLNIIVFMTLRFTAEMFYSTALS